MTGAPALVIDTRRATSARLVGGGLDPAPAPQRAPARAPRAVPPAEIADHRRRADVAEAARVRAEAAAEVARRRADTLAALLDTIEARYNALDIDATAARVVLAELAPGAAGAPLADLASLVARMAKQATGGPLRRRWVATAPPGPETRHCPAPGPEEAAWARIRSPRFAPWVCPHCDRPFHVRRHAEAHLGRPIASTGETP